MVDFLMDKGLDVNAKDRRGRTPLIYAVLGGHPATIARLSRLGARLYIKDSGHRNAMDWAIYTKQKEVIQALKKPGVPAPEITGSGKNGLEISVRELKRQNLKENK